MQSSLHTIMRPLYDFVKTKKKLCDDGSVIVSPPRHSLSHTGIPSLLVFAREDDTSHDKKRDNQGE
jgi:hypothetical protein